MIIEEIAESGSIERYFNGTASIGLRSPYIDGRGGPTTTFHNTKETKVYHTGVASFVLGVGSMPRLGNGRITLVTGAPGAFDDFAVFGLGTQTTNLDQRDPRVGVFCVSEDLGSTTATDWYRVHRTLYPPANTRFMVPLLHFYAKTNGSNHYVDANQLEILPDHIDTPSDYQHPRTLHAQVRPALVNLCQNPNGLIDTSHWDGVTLTPGGGGFTSTGTAILTMDDTNEGGIFTVSAYVSAGASDLKINGTTPEFIETPNSSLPLRVAITFSTFDDYRDITFTSANPFNFGKVMVTQGDLLWPYFDGSSQPATDYLWEQGGTPGLARSYYYPDRPTRHAILTRTLEENIPFPLSIAEPQYGLPDAELDNLYGAGTFGAGYFGGGVPYPIYDEGYFGDGGYGL